MWLAAPSSPQIFGGKFGEAANQSRYPLELLMATACKTLDRSSSVSHFLSNSWLHLVHVINDVNRGNLARIRIGNEGAFARIIAQFAPVLQRTSLPQSARPGRG